MESLSLAASSLCTSRGGPMERHCYPGSVSLVGFSSPRLKTPSFPKSLKKRSFGLVRASAAVETKVAIIRIGTRGRYLFFLSSFFFSRLVCLLLWVSYVMYLWIWLNHLNHRFYWCLIVSCNSVYGSSASRFNCKYHVLSTIYHKLYPLFLLIGSLIDVYSLNLVGFG